MTAQAKPEPDMWDKVYDVYWEGPFTWDEALAAFRRGHVLYAIFGAEPDDGRSRLLHLERSAEVGGTALGHHESWVRARAGDVTVHLASVGHFSTWKEWRSVSRHPQAPPEIVEPVEALLVRANRPSRIPVERQVLASFHQLRVFNSGSRGTLLPESSYRFYLDP